MRSLAEHTQNVPTSCDAPDFAAWEAAFLTAQMSFRPSNLGHANDRVELDEEFESLVTVRTGDLKHWRSWKTLDSSPQKNHVDSSTGHGGALARGAVRAQGCGLHGQERRRQKRGHARISAVRS